MLKWPWVFGFWLCAAAQAAAPAPLPALTQATLLRVTDGDSLWLQPAGGGKPLEVRLQGIDAPELCQEGGAQARATLADMLAQQALSFKPTGRDEFGRTLGDLYAGESFVNSRMVEEGQAWSLRFKWDQGPFVKQERMARALARGVHAQGGAVMPRDFRLNHGPCQPGQAPAAAPAPVTVTAPAPRVGASAFRCDGRTYCSQMGSCEEAKYFLAHCPGVKMDGDRNGQPCEKQWCGR